MISSTQYDASEINNLPEVPGIYIFHDKNKKIIYVGKSKNIKKRVSSYYSNVTTNSTKTKKLVSEIETIEITCVNSENEALLLENNLIKRHQPKYNILLKDDKSYPYICITNERFPKITPIRNLPARVNTNLFGPFSNIKNMYQILNLIKELYPLRTCKHSLTQKNIEIKKFKVCLDYHIGNCLGPCVALQSEENYNENISYIKELLKGNFSAIKAKLKILMNNAAKITDYKSASIYKNKIDIIDEYQSKSIIVNSDIKFIDIFSFIAYENLLFINYMQINNGMINFSKTFTAETKINEDFETFVPRLVYDITKSYKSKALEYITNIPIELTINNVKIYYPQAGDKKKMVLLSQQNAILAKEEYLNKKQETPEWNKQIIEKLQKELSLKRLPKYIACFDNSNLFGTNPVAAMVVFKDGVAAKTDYKYFNIKTVQGPDDYASMYEVVLRSMENLKKENNIPDLIIIDGGKGQIASAIQALRDCNIYEQVDIIAIAKKLEEIFTQEKKLSILLNKDSTVLKLIQRIRDEAHRSAVSFHRKKRSFSSLSSNLDAIPGVGPKTKSELLNYFKHLENIKNSLLEDLIKIVGKHKATIIYNFFHNPS